MEFVEFKQDTTEPPTSQSPLRITDFPVTFASLESSIQNANRALGNKILKQAFPFDEGVYHTDTSFAVEHAGESGGGVELGVGVKEKIEMTGELRKVEVELERVKREAGVRISELEDELKRSFDEVVRIKEESRTDEYEKRIKSFEAQVF
jgi:hypothetical protein